LLAGSDRESSAIWRFLPILWQAAAQADKKRALRDDGSSQVDVCKRSARQHPLVGVSSNELIYVARTEPALSVVAVAHLDVREDVFVV